MSLMPPRSHSSFSWNDARWCVPSRARLKRVIKEKILRYVDARHAIFSALVVVTLCAFTFSQDMHDWVFQTKFDDNADMDLIAVQDAEYVRQKQNESGAYFGDPLRLLNASDVRQHRLAWDYIYGSLRRNPNPPVLTKYKTRLLRELYAKTHYKVVNKFSPSLDVSCNYMNDINDTGSLFSFRCSDTSHRCPDGNFSRQPAFVPKEGSSVTWSNIVIVLMVSAGREAYLDACAETWISRLHPEATLFFGRDGEDPPLPLSVMNRQNTHVYAYEGPPGLDGLDVKAFIVWREVYRRFATEGKKYFLKVDDDAFLVGHNLVRFLNKMEHWMSGVEQSLYFGHPFCGHGDLEALGFATWCYAGGGAYGLSLEALQNLLSQISDGCAYFYDYLANAPGLRPGSDRYGGRYEDVMVGRCLRQARTRNQLRGTSLLACGSFIPYAPLHYYEQFGMSKEAMSKKLDGDIITIHSLEPSAIRYLDHMVFEYPLNEDVSLFSASNKRVQELIDVCKMDGKKMSCDLSSVSIR